MRLTHTKNTKTIKNSMDIRTMDEAERLTDNQILKYLKELWKSDTLRLSGEYTGESFVKVKSGNIPINYPINNAKVYFKFTNSRLIIGQRYYFECELADRDYREGVNNLFRLNIIPSTVSELQDYDAEISKIKTV